MRTAPGRGWEGSGGAGWGRGLLWSFPRFWAEGGCCSASPAGPVIASGRLCALWSRFYGLASLLLACLSSLSLAAWLPIAVVGVRVGRCRPRLCSKCQPMAAAAGPERRSHLLPGAPPPPFRGACTVGGLRRCKPVVVREGTAALCPHLFGFFFCLFVFSFFWFVMPALFGRRDGVKCIVSALSMSH